MYHLNIRVIRYRLRPHKVIEYCLEFRLFTNSVIAYFFESRDQFNILNWIEGLVCFLFWWYGHHAVANKKEKTPRLLHQVYRFIGTGLNISYGLVHIYHIQFYDPLSFNCISVKICLGKAFLQYWLKQIHLFGIFIYPDDNLVTASRHFFQLLLYRSFFSYIDVNTV